MRPRYPYAHRVTVLLALLLTAGGGLSCTADDVDVGDPVVALFEIPRAGKSTPFYSLPFPNDIRLDPDGSINMDGFPQPNTYLRQLVAIFDQHTFGFGTTSGTFFRFTGGIRAAALPPTPWHSVQEGSSVYLVDITPSSPGYGERTPVTATFTEAANDFIGDHWLAVVPVPGFALRQSTTYAVILTSDVRDARGRRIDRSADFEALLSEEIHPDPDVEAARTRYGPLRLYLAEREVDLRTIVNATVFTTQNITGRMEAIRDAVYRDMAPPPARPADFKYRRANTGHHLYEGTFEAPNYQSGTPPYTTAGGGIPLDPSGSPVLQRTETLRFAVSIPDGEMPPNGWPIVLYAHGTGGSYLSFSGRVARNLANIYVGGQVRAQAAVIGIDQVLHGPRCGEASSCEPEINFFNVQNPLAGRDNVLQGALDNFQLKRLVQAMDIPNAPGTGRPIRFDPERIYFMGHSQGGLTGPPFLGVEPDIKAAVLSGASGNLTITLLSKTEPVDIVNLIQLLLPSQEPLDANHPLFSLLQLFIDPVDSINWGRYFINEPRPGVPPKHIFLSQGWIDHLSPTLGIEAFGLAIGLDPVAPQIDTLHFLPLTVHDQFLPRPASGNLLGGTITGVMAQYLSWSDGHYVVFDNPQANLDYRHFLGTAITAGIPRLEPLP